MVKRAYVELRDRVSYLKRLAFFTFTEEEAAQIEWVHATGSKAEAIDAVVTVDEADIETNRRALDCYVTYKETIEQSGRTQANDQCLAIPQNASERQQRVGRKSATLLSKYKDKYYSLIQQDTSPRSDRLSCLGGAAHGDDLGRACGGPGDEVESLEAGKKA